jgi:hypothetical protein
VVKISAQSEHFSVHVLKVGHSKFWLFKPIFRHLDPDSEYGSGSRSKLNADPTGSGSETLMTNSTSGSATPTPRKSALKLSTVNVLKITFGAGHQDGVGH